ncbi:MAG: GTPase HflX [Planctomycetes bacterium]|nr:GTPase HflX [Planctomycetota bacterium]
MTRDSFNLPFEARERAGDGKRTRAVALKAIQIDDPSRKSEQIDPFEELLALADTAGIEVAGTVSQRRNRPHPATYVGKGKIEELKRLVEECGAKLVLVDDPLSPKQGNLVEDGVGVQVVDRTELIMDIFATRARTRQAQMQVELAQLRYSQSRLKRMWTHLSRFEGGIGMRGPGETQIETDRRIIHKKIAMLEDRLREIEQQVATQHKGRADTFQVALVGYTNAGKSTLMRRLTGADVLVENRLFSTLDTSTRRWELPCARDVLLSDTVGFIRKLPAGLVASFHATLMETREADLLLHVVDGSSPQVENDMAVVEETLQAIGCADKPRFLLFNKIDLLPEDRRIDLKYLLEHNSESLAVSAVTGAGIDELVTRVLERASANDRVMEFALPIARGDLLSRLHDMGKIVDQRYEEDRIVVQARLTSEEQDRFRIFLAKNGIAAK